VKIGGKTIVLLFLHDNGRNIGGGPPFVVSDFKRVLLVMLLIFVLTS